MICDKYRGKNTGPQCVNVHMVVMMKVDGPYMDNDSVIKKSHQNLQGK
jgi:hypothetical protein